MDFIHLPASSYSSIREWNSLTDEMCPTATFCFFSLLVYFTLTHFVFEDTRIILLLYNPNLNKFLTYLPSHLPTKPDC